MNFLYRCISYRSIECHFNNEKYLCMSDKNILIINSYIPDNLLGVPLKKK